MQVTRLEAIFRALNEAQAEYLVVGGVAVIAHGHSRLTNDLDRLIEMKREVARPQDLIDADKLTILKAIQDENP